MVLPSPPPDDAPRSPAPDWLTRLSFILRVANGGVIVLIAGAKPPQLGPLVRGLIDQYPDIEVYTDATRLVEAPHGSVSILVPEPSQATWLNLIRPMFAQRALKVLLFADDAAVTALAQRAPDFYSWISHRVECPSDPPAHLVEAFRRALCERARAIEWFGGDVMSIFQAAFPGRTLTMVSTSLPYRDMVSAARSVPKTWIGWTDINGANRLRRARWAMIEARRRAGAVIINPAVRSEGVTAIHGEGMPISGAIAMLRESGVKAPGRFAALLDSSPDGVKACAQALSTGTSAVEIERALLRGEGVRGSAAEADEDSVAWSHGTRLDVAQEAVDAGEPHIALRLAQEALAAAPDEREALAVAGRALHKLSRLTEAEGVLRRAVQLNEQAGGGLVRASHLMSLASVLEEQHRFDDANDLLAEAESITGPAATRHYIERLFRETPRVSHPQLLAMAPMIRATFHQAHSVAQQQRARNLERLGHYHDAEVLLRAVMEDEDPNQEDPLLLRTLAKLSMNQGRYQEAETTVRRALERSAISSEYGSLYTKLLQDLADYLTLQGRYEEAEGLYRGCLDAWERDGGEPLFYVAALTRLAHTLHAQGRFEEVEGLLRRAVLYGEASIGPNDPILSNALLRLGLLLSLQGKASEGVPLVERAVTIMRAAHGERHPDTARTLVTLAQVQAANNNPQAAETIRAAYTILRETLGPEHPDTQRAESVLKGITGATSKG